MTSRQRSLGRSSWDRVPAQRSASTGGEVPVAPDRQEAHCRRQGPLHHRAADHAGGGISMQRADVCKGEDV